MSKTLALTVATWAAAMTLIAGSAHAAASGERFVLSGVVFVDGARGLAWLQEPVFTNGRMVPVHVGDTVGPFRVTRILEDQVELEGPGGKVAVPLAGASGPGSTAAQSGTKESSTAGLPPHPALNNPHAIVIPPGDPRQEFPTSVMLLGGGAQLVRGKARRDQPEMSGRVASPPVNDVPVPASMQPPVHQLPPSPALSNPHAIVIPPGDPRQEFPVSEMLGH